VFNEVFTFDIETGNKQLEVLVNSRSDFGSDGFLVILSLVLKSLKTKLNMMSGLILSQKTQPRNGKAK